MASNGLPAVHPDGAMSPHLEVLHALVRRRFGVVKRVDHAVPMDRHLTIAMVATGSRFAKRIEYRRDDVRHMVELVANLPLGNLLRPADDERYPDPSSIGVALVPAQRCVGDLRPTPRHIGPTPRGTDVLDPVLQGSHPILLHGGTFDQRNVQQPTLV